MNATNSKSRRELLKYGALLGAGALAASSGAAPAVGQVLAAPKKPQRRLPAQKEHTGDLQILQFALGLEYLEQNFYAQAAHADINRQFLHGRLHEIVPLLRDNEAAHVAALSAAIVGLGGLAAAAPTFAFPAEVFISPITFTRFAAALEEIGIGAYLGAVGKISNLGLRRAAASIYGTETRHAALLHHLGGYPFSERYYEGELSISEVQTLVAPYLAGAAPV